MKAGWTLALALFKFVMCTVGKQIGMGIWWINTQGKAFTSSL